MDNGLVDGDLILTTQQARILIDNLKKAENKAEGSFRRKRLTIIFISLLFIMFQHFRSSLFFEINKNFAQKWDVSNPIPYAIADDFSKL